MSTAVQPRSACEPTSASIESLGLYVLLDFLTGDSLEDVTLRHRLPSTTAAEALIRVVLLKHGFTVN